MAAVPSLRNLHAFANWQKIKQMLKHPKAELLLFENYSHSSSTLSSKNNKTYSKKEAKEHVCLYS